MQENWAKLGVAPTEILLPKQGVDLYSWSVIACDQFTSDQEYWDKVEGMAGENPSALRLIYPEIYLNQEPEKTISRINSFMDEYLSRDLFIEYPQAMIYIERTQSNGKIRRGLVLAVDLEAYDYRKGAKSLVRATEGTIEDRLPPRIKIRINASLELPHIMLLIDDPFKTVIEPLAQGGLKEVYSTDLMLGGGSIKGFLAGKEAQEKISQALQALADPEAFRKKYQLSQNEELLLFAAGDGNHSLATAKVCYEQLKQQIGALQASTHPARYALVELVNLHDEALEFEPIHRVLFNVEPAEFINEMQTRFAGGEVSGQSFTCIVGETEKTVAIANPTHNLTVGTLQAFLDEYLAAHPNCKIDYIHEAQTVRCLGKQTGNIGFILPAMDKSQLFKTVIKDGVLPRKTFSMGNGQDKRYYMEARRIK